MSLERHVLQTQRGALAYLFAPAHGRRASPEPLVVFLHGARDRGSDLDKLLAHGLPRVLAHAAPVRYHFLALQIPEASAWADWRDDLLGLVESLAGPRGIDRRRVVLAGFSAGSAAAWEFAAQAPDQIAGLIIVAGRVPASLDNAALERLGGIPTWVFHGGRDEGAPAAPVEEVVRRLRAVGGSVRYTHYPDEGHQISDRAYGDADLQRWIATIPRRYGPPRVPEHAVDPVFVHRWSPRALSAEAIDAAELLRILEAARWAPSAGNSQPWRFIYRLHGEPGWDEAVDLLADNNRLWAPRASSLILLVSKTTFRRPGSDAPVAAANHSFDAGASWGYLSLQAALSGWSTRAIGGFDRERARALFEVPEGYKVEILIALGRLGTEEGLPLDLVQREAPSRRRPLGELVAHGTFSLKDA